MGALANKYSIVRENSELYKSVQAGIIDAALAGLQSDDLIVQGWAHMVLADPDKESKVAMRALVHLGLQADAADADIVAAIAANLSLLSKLAIASCLVPQLKSAAINQACAILCEGMSENSTQLKATLAALISTGAQTFFGTTNEGE